MSDQFTFFDLATGDPRASLRAVDGQLIVRSLSGERYVHSFAVRRRADRALLAVRNDGEIKPGDRIYVIEAARLRPGFTPRDEDYREHPIRFGPLLVAMQQGDEFVDIE